jgi:hypothetical protein
MNSWLSRELPVRKTHLWGLVAIFMSLFLFGEGVRTAATYRLRTHSNAGFAVWGAGEKNPNRQVGRIDIGRRLA